MCHGAIDGRFGDLPSKNLLASNRFILLLFLVLLIMTGAFTQQAGSAKTTLGHLAPFLPAAFLTFYLIMLLAFSKTIIEAITNFFVVGPSGPRPGSKLLTSLLFFVFVVITIVALMRSNPSAMLAFLGVIQQAAILFTSATQIHPASTINTSTASTQTLLLTYYSLIAFGSIFVISLSIVLIAFGCILETITTIYVGLFVYPFAPIMGDTSIYLIAVFVLLALFITLREGSPIDHHRDLETN